RDRYGAQIYRASRLIARRRFAAAIQELEAARKLADTPGVRVLLVEATRRAGDIERAITHQTELVQRRPRDVDRRVLLARLHAGRGDVATACRQLLLAYDMSPTHPALRQQLARLRCTAPVAPAAPKAR